MTGALLGRVGLDRRTPLAAATLMLGANAPDIDIVSVWAGSYASIAFRRGWTHGPLAMLLLPVALTGLMLLWDRLVRRRRSPEAPPADPRWVLALAVIGVWSHPLLDWLNTYGIRLLMPFSDRWFAGDAVFIVDPILWLLLASALVAARRGFPLRRVQHRAAWALGYVLLLVVLSPLGERRTLAQVRAGALPEATEVMYQPQPASPHRATLVVVTPRAYHLGRFDWLPSPRATLEGTVLPRGDWSLPAVQAARRRPDARDFLIWSRYPWVRVEGDGTVVFGDARFPEGGITGGLGGVRIPPP
jgi:inner membrane protein